jgi:lincosamide nucleotidyltransferase A/C/D/E
VHADQLVDLLDRIDAVTPTVWLAGGWGVDALAGQETRPHRDADLCVDAPSLPAAQQLTFRAGFTWRSVDHHDVALLRELT